MDTILPAITIDDDSCVSTFKSYSTPETVRNTKDKPNGQTKQTASKPLFETDNIDFSRRIRSAKDIESKNPHREHMALLDWIVWENQEKTQAIGLKEVRLSEFWVPGHFPERPILPGVLMVEAGAQLACYLVNSRKDSKQIPLFLGIEEASFRSKVVPGDNLYILCQQVYDRHRRFVFSVQGWVNERIAFDGRIAGCSLGRD